MNAVITVIGHDMVGILAKVSAVCAENGVNIEEVTQSILRDMFAMIMLVDLKNCKCGISELDEQFKKAGKEMNVDIRITRQELSDAMHRI